MFLYGADDTYNTLTTLSALLHDLYDIIMFVTFCSQVMADFRASYSCDDKLGYDYLEWLSILVVTNLLNGCWNWLTILLVNNLVKQHAMDKMIIVY